MGRKMRAKVKRRAQQVAHGSDERWLVSYADFITLLFAFFVIMYATSSKDKGEAHKFEASVKKYLAKFSGAVLVGSQGTDSDERGDSGPGEKLDQQLKNPLDKHSSDSPEVGALQRAIEMDIESNLSEAEIKKYVQDVYSDKKGVKIILYADSVYDGDSTYLLNRSLPFLDKLGQMLSRHDGSFVIENHVHKGFRSPSGHPIDVTSLRSNLLARYYAKNNYFPIERSVPIGFGDLRPRFSNAHEDAIKKNSRVVIYLTDELF